MGHEFSGTILEVSPDVPNASSFKPGQKCAIQPTIFCQSCGACRNGVENACPNGGFIGLSGKCTFVMLCEKEDTDQKVEI